MEKANNYKEQALRAVFTRRSVRSYKEGEIAAPDIGILLKAAMAAPSACNLQPWEFVVVTDKDMLGKIRDAAFSGKYNVPLIIVVCANTSNVPWSGENWRMDCSAAVTNMMIAAEALGIGSVWVGGYDDAAVRALLDIPDNIKVLSLIYFGYAEQENSTGTRYNEQAVYWGKYDPQRKREMRTMDMVSDISVKPLDFLT